MDGIRATLEATEDGVARLILYEDDNNVRSFTWDPDDLPDDASMGAQFEVSFAEEGNADSEVVGLTYSEEMTEQRHEELRIPTVERLVRRNAPESKIRGYLERSGASDEEIENIFDEYVRDG